MNGGFAARSDAARTAPSMTPPRLPRKKRFPTACVRAHDARMSGPSEKDEEEDEEEDIPFTPNSGDAILIHNEIPGAQ